MLRKCVNPCVSVKQTRFHFRGLKQAVARVSEPAMRTPCARGVSRHGGCFRIPSVLPVHVRHATIPSMSSELSSDTIPVPATVRFHTESAPPPGSLPESPGSWPRLECRLESDEVSLLY